MRWDYQIIAQLGGLTDLCRCQRPTSISPVGRAGLSGAVANYAQQTTLVQRWCPASARSTSKVNAPCPIGQNIAAAIRRTAGNFNATGRLRLVNMRGGGGVRIETADARSPSGARVIVSGGDGVTYYWPDARVRVDGDIAMGGGGLPRANVTLRQSREGGPMSGEARIMPYVAGNSRLALAPVTFKAAPGGGTAVTTVAVVDGPFSGGFVRGLRVPISGTIGGAGGGFAFGRGCIDARFQSLSVGALSLNASRVPLWRPRSGLVFRDGQVPVQSAARLAICGSAGSWHRHLRSGRAGAIVRQQ